MNRVVLVGRIAREPETRETPSGIKYTRFVIAVNRLFAENQTDFIPIVAWRNQAIFIENYLNKGALISIDGRFTSSNYINSENQQVFRYEVTAERVNSLETRAQREAREETNNKPESTSAISTQEMEFAEESKSEDEVKKIKDVKDVPWDIDL